MILDGVHFLDMVKITKPNYKGIVKAQVEYRNSVQTWSKILNSNKDNKYGDRLMVAVQRMKKKYEILLQLVNEDRENREKEEKLNSFNPNI